MFLGCQESSQTCHGDEVSIGSGSGLGFRSFRDWRFGFRVFGAANDKRLELKVLSNL